jgi:hypothetical protein
MTAQDGILGDLKFSTNPISNKKGCSDEHPVITISLGNSRRLGSANLLLFLLFLGCFFLGCHELNALLKKI